MLTDQQRRDVLALARRAVTAHVLGQPQVDARRADLPRASGAFVTIKRRGELRGCLGVLDSPLDLGEQIVRCAADASSEDPRFPPVRPAEIPDLSIEVSVLGPLERIDPSDPDAIVIGRHGLVVEQGRARGLLLPQVATEHGWTRDQFLRQTCVKAHLPADAWQHGATVFRFDAEVIAE